MRRYRCLASDPISAERFALTTVQDDHVEPIRLWRNAQRDVLRQARELSADDQREYFAAKIWPSLAEHHPTDVLLTFFEEERAIGYGGLVHIAWEHRRAEVSFLLAPELTADREGYARRFSTFLDLLARVAFDQLGLHRLFTETFAHRVEHLAILESAGFVPEGRMREHVFIDGRPVDSLLHGRLADRSG